MVTMTQISKENWPHSPHYSVVNTINAFPYPYNRNCLSSHNLFILYERIVAISDGLKDKNLTSKIDFR